MVDSNIKNKLSFLEKLIWLRSTSRISIFIEEKGLIYEHVIRPCTSMTNCIQFIIDLRDKMDNIYIREIRLITYPGVIRLYNKDYKNKHYHHYNVFGKNISLITYSIPPSENEEQLVIIRHGIFHRYTNDNTGKIKYENSTNDI